MAAYLDKAGLTYLWSKIKAYIDSHSGGGSGASYHLSKSGNAITLTGTDGTSDSVEDSNTTYSSATTSAAGLMSAEDKTKLNAIGTIAGAINGSTSIANVSVPTGEWTNLGTFSLDTGTWVVKVSTRWASKSNATGYRTLSISTSSAEEGLSVWNNAKIAPSTTGYTYLHLITFLKPSSAATTYYVNAYNSDSSAHACAVRWGAIKIDN